MSTLKPGNTAIWLDNPGIKRAERPVTLIRPVADGRRWEVELAGGNRIAVRTEELRAESDDCTCDLHGDDPDCPQHGREAIFWERVDWAYAVARDK